MVQQFNKTVFSSSHLINNNKISFILSFWSLDTAFACFVLSLNCILTYVFFIWQINLYPDVPIFVTVETQTRNFILKIL